MALFGMFGNKYKGYNIADDRSNLTFEKFKEKYLPLAALDTNEQKKYFEGQNLSSIFSYFEHCAFLATHFKEVFNLADEDD